jgi:uncharacterized membrane protein
MEDYKSSLSGGVSQNNRRKKTLLPIEALVSVIGFILLLSVFKPICMMTGFNLIAQVTNWPISLICHQCPSRCLALIGVRLAICSRCFAFYSAMFLCALWYWRKGLLLTSITTRGLLLLLAPLIIDGTTQFLGLRSSTNTLRIITGFLAGVGKSLSILPFLADKCTRLTIHSQQGGSDA